MTTTRILVADDDHDWTDAMAIRAKTMGLEVHIAHDGAAAINAARDLAPDLVCLDVNMPAGGGLAVCEAFAEDERLSSMPVIIVTGRTDQHTIGCCRRLRAYYAPKGPDLWRRLDMLIHEVLELEPGKRQRPDVVGSKDSAAVSARDARYRRRKTSGRKLARESPDRGGLPRSTERALARRQPLRECLCELEDQVRDYSVALRRAHEETLHRLMIACGCRDADTARHAKRTGLFAEVLAKMAGWSTAEVELIRLAAPVHDIGKIGIPDAILGRCGELTPEEREVIKMHTALGAKMLSGSQYPILQMAEKIARHHHERWDGKGYPDGLAGWEIPECARIVAIVDVFDALSHDRPYRSALPSDQVLSILKDGRSRHFDPSLLDLFFAGLPEIQRIAGDFASRGGEDTYAACVAG